MTVHTIATLTVVIFPSHDTDAKRQAVRFCDQYAERNPVADVIVRKTGELTCITMFPQ